MRHCEKQKQQKGTVSDLLVQFFKQGVGQFSILPLLFGGSPRGHQVLPIDKSN